MDTTERRRPLEEVARLGEAMFDRQVKPLLRPEDHGKFVAIDVDSGDYEIDGDEYTAITRLRARKANADVWLVRAGFPSAHKMGMR